MYNFGTFSEDKEKAIDASERSSLIAPYLGVATFMSVKRAQLEGNFDVLEFRFRTKEEPIGTEIVHLEWAPNDQTDDKKLGNMVNRVGYIFSRIVNKEIAMKVISFTANSKDEVWEKLNANIERLVAQAGNKLVKDVVVKVLPNARTTESGTQWNFAFPKYKNFIYDVSERENVKFTPQEQKNIDLWRNSESQPAPTDGFSSASGNYTAPAPQNDPSPAADGGYNF